MSGFLKNWAAKINIYPQSVVVLKNFSFIVYIFQPGLDIGYVPTGSHAFLRLSGQFGPPQFIFHWPEGPVVFFFSASYAAIIFTGNRQNSEGNVNSYIFFVIGLMYKSVQLHA